MKQILVIDDDDSVREAYELALDGDRAEVHLASSGKEGISIARKIRPDLVFLDLKMPEMDGIETMRALAEIYSSLNIFIVTAFAAEFMEELKMAKKDGLEFEVASKPLRGAQIRQIAQATFS